MLVPNLTEQVLDRFAELAKTSEWSDSAIIQSITAGVRANPSMGRQKILEIATAAAEGIDGSVA